MYICTDLQASQARDQSVSVLTYNTVKPSAYHRAWYAEDAQLNE